MHQGKRFKRASAVANSLIHDNVIDGSDTSNNGFSGILNGQTVYNNYCGYTHLCFSRASTSSTTTSASTSLPR